MILPKLAYFTSIWKKYMLPGQVNNLAQWVTIISFPCAMYFSYLAWSEARTTRLDQIKYFNIEKGPHLVIDRLEKQKIGNVWSLYDVKIKNDGISSAKNILLDISIFSRDSINAHRPDIPNCLSRSIGKNSIATCGLRNLPYILIDSGYDPSDIEFIESDASVEHGRKFIGGLNIDYDGEFEDHYSVKIGIFGNDLDK